MSNIKDQVEFVLEGFPETRDSDKELIKKILWCFYNRFIVNEKFINIDDINNLPNFDSITRLKRWFQNKGLYRGTEKIHKDKKEKAESVRITIKSLYPQQFLPL